MTEWRKMASELPMKLTQKRFQRFFIQWNHPSRKERETLQTDPVLRREDEETIAGPRFREGQPVVIQFEMRNKSMYHPGISRSPERLDNDLRGRIVLNAN
jgi:hypothetical protein